MTIPSDFHSHVSRSSAREMAESAQALGLHVLGLSEHVFQMNEARPLLEHMPLEGSMSSFAEYIQAVRTASSDIEVRLGLEVDYIPGKNEAIQAALKNYNWDFLIGSVHEVDGVLFENSSNVGVEKGRALWIRYYELLRGAITSGYFSLVSHPIRMRTTNPHLPPTLDEELEHLAAEATRCNVALEINGYDVKVYPSLVRRLARACAIHRTPISIGSDAHIPAKVAQSHAESEIILREAGIRRVRIWKQRVAEEYEIQDN